jgi:glycosyltransferase involved in cell wall biosynthesis
LVASGRKLVLWAGRFEESKRADVLIDAFARVASTATDWDVILLGDGPARAAAIERVEQFGLSARIHLPGFAGNLADWYHRADAFVMTSSYEGFPNALMEAQAEGLPSIAFDVLTGPRELSAGGRRLVLLPDRNHVESLADALSALLSDDAQREKLGRAARETAVDYSKERVLAMWDELFAKVAVSGSTSEAKS